MAAVQVEPLFQDNRAVGVEVAATFELARPCPQSSWWLVSAEAVAT